MDAYLVSGPWPYLVAFAVCAVCCLLLSRLALISGHIDLPEQGAHKTHEGGVPLTGGIAIFVAFFIVFFMSNLAGIESLGFYLLAAFILVIGMLDDRLQLPAHLRLVAQLVAATSIAISGSIQLGDLGNLAGTGPVLLSPVAGVLFTVFCIVGVINALNMIDGVDGLAGSVSVVVLLGIGAVAFVSGQVAIVENIGLLLAAILAFVMLFNFPSPLRLRRVFLGDAGSMFLGFVIAIASVRVASVDNALVYPITMVWILGLLVIDTVATVIRRLWRGVNPMAPGRDHLHHILQAAGLGPRQTVMVIAFAQVLLASVGIAGWMLGWAESFLAAGFVVLGFGYLGVTQLTWSRLILPNPVRIEARREADLHGNLLFNVSMFHNTRVAGEADDGIFQDVPGSPGGTPVRSSGSISEQREIV